MLRARVAISSRLHIRYCPATIILAGGLVRSSSQGTLTYSRLAGRYAQAG